MNTLQIALIVHALAFPDIWTSRLSVGGRVLWSFVIVFMPVVGLAAWILTRHTARHPIEAYLPDEPVADEPELEAGEGRLPE